MTCVFCEVPVLFLFLWLDIDFIVKYTKLRMWQTGCVFFIFIELSMFMNRFTRQQINIMLNYMHAEANMALYGWRKKMYKLIKKVFYIIFAGQYCICNRFFLSSSDPCANFIMRGLRPICEKLLKKFISWSDQ